MSRVSLDYLKRLPETGITAMRSGIIPYYRDSSGQVWWLLATTHSNQLTDLGGGARVSQQESPIDCALREFREEIGAAENTRHSIHMFYDQIKSNVNDPEKTIVYELPSRNNPQICRYFFTILVEVPRGITKDFRPTEEIKSIDWYTPESLFVMYPSLISGSFIGWVRLMSLSKTSARSAFRSAEQRYQRIKRQFSV